MSGPLLTLKNNHVFICGITRSGKTYFAKTACAKLRGPVLFFNIQDETMPAPFINVTHEYEYKDILNALRKGYKLNFTFGGLSLAQIMRVIGFLCDSLMISGAFSQARPVYIVIDEAQILEDRALKAAIAISTRGLARGVRLIAITQRPALCNKTIYTQAAEQYIFRLAPSEAQYIKNKGIDYDYCLSEWERLGDYSYIFSDGFVLRGNKAI